MKLDRNSLIIGLIFILGLLFFLQKDRERNLPDGKISETTPPVITFPSVTPEPITGRPTVEVNTSKGTFTIELRPDLAPESVVNFLVKWSKEYCDKSVFHRVEDWVVQGCDPQGDGTGGKDSLPTENSTESFLAGSVGVARKPYPKDKSNDSQFFVVKKDSRFLDGEYTYLGRVVSGMEVVNSLTVGDTINSTIALTK
jgi:cyclophilin family peptidyl-prolyl cis-trans isomerase